MFCRNRTNLLAVAATLGVMVLAVPRAQGQDEPNPITAKVKATVKDPTRPFTLIVRLQAKEEAGKKIEAAFAKAIKPSRQEKGCLVYDLNRDPKQPTHFLVYERWQSLAALEAHLKSPHITALLMDLGDLVAGPPEIHVLVPVGD